jgi:predicted kinase
MCGKIASGKTTLARTTADACGGVLISEDVWLDRMYPGEHFTVQDYVRRSTRLRAALGPHVSALLRRGVSVVFDFAGNTPRERQWARAIAEDGGADLLVHFLNIPDAVCRARLRARNIEAPEGSQHTTDAEFDAISAYFVTPSDGEGVRIREHVE